MQQGHCFSQPGYATSMHYGKCSWWLVLLFWILVLKIENVPGNCTSNTPIHPLHMHIFPNLIRAQQLCRWEECVTLDASYPSSLEALFIMFKLFMLIYWFKGTISDLANVLQLQGNGRHFEEEVQVWCALEEVLYSSWGWSWWILIKFHSTTTTSHHRIPWIYKYNSGFSNVLVFSKIGKTCQAKSKNNVEQYNQNWAFGLF